MPNRRSAPPTRSSSCTHRVAIANSRPELEGPSIETYFVYPEELRHSKRIAVFRDFLLKKVKQSGF